jgi:hypothetical protein
MHMARSHSRPRCGWGERLRDSLTALQAGRHGAVVTADRTFAARGELLGQPIVLLPSLAELKRWLVTSEDAGPGAASPAGPG